eukprot:jgi/Botrbrau1/11846/Bobra.0175s0008.1
MGHTLSLPPRFPCVHRKPAPVSGTGFHFWLLGTWFEMLEYSPQSIILSLTSRHRSPPPICSTLCRGGAVARAAQGNQA